MFNAFKHIREGNPTGILELDDFLLKIKNKEIPLKAPFPLKSYDHDFDFDKVMYESAARGVATKLGMWAVVDLDWTSNLSKWIGDRKCLEVMSGVGWLSKALSIAKVDITATDDLSWMEDAHKNSSLVHEILEYDAIDAVNKFLDAEILIISWPPYTCNKILEVCEQWGSDRPIVYIGENAGGCNAPDKFFNNFIEDDSVSIEIPRYYGLHDKLMVGYWKKKNINL
jgi:hypothetical protein